MHEVTIRIRNQKLTADLAKRPISFGRAADATVAIHDDPLLSRLHCVLEASPQGVILRDLNSKNGTWVRGKKIHSMLLAGELNFTIGQTDVRITPTATAGQLAPTPGNPGAPGSLGSGHLATDVEDDGFDLDIPDLVDDAPAPGSGARGASDFGVIEHAAATSGGAASGGSGGSRGGVFKKGGYGFDSIHRLALIGADEPGAFGADAIELLNARGNLVHAAEGGRQTGASANTLGLLRLMLLGCIRSGASDIHLEPKRLGGQLRLRIDGAMVPISELDPEDTKRLMSMVKILCDIDIAQQAIIQEGHFSAEVPGRRIDYRVSYTPAMNGQKMVVRVLDPHNAPQKLFDLGMPKWMHERIENLTRQDTGMLLVCGPTGSGKTTTLYATLRQIDAQARNIITIEDPVEYEIEGVTQMPVKAEQGSSFLSLLRSCLRQDPDVVVLGEIRDKDTAVTAMQAATTGHMVFSTIHAKDTMGIIFRLLDLQVEPYLIASTLNVLLAQRLVRRLCPHCKTQTTLTDKEKAQLLAGSESATESTAPNTAETEANQTPDLDTAYAANGCPQCFNTGYQGRLGLFEMLVVNDPIRDAILAGASIAEIKSHLKPGQHQTLMSSARDLVASGETSMEEIHRTVGFGD